MSAGGDSIPAVGVVAVIIVDALYGAMRGSIRMGGPNPRDFIEFLVALVLVDVVISVATPMVDGIPPIDRRLGVAAAVVVVVAVLPKAFDRNGFPPLPYRV